MENLELHQLLDNFFASTHQRTANLIQKYSYLYSLPLLTKSFEVDPHFFFHRANSVNFVTVALYNNQKEILIVNSRSQLGPEEIVGWRLPGGPILDQKGETIEEAVNNIVRKHTGLEITELEPIAVVKNNFTWGDSPMEHLGLAFIARVVGKVKVSGNQEWKFTIAPPEKMAFQNREVFFLATDKIQQKYFEPPLEEIKSSRRIFILKLFHKFIFKPISYWSSSIPLKKRIKSFIKNPHSVLDVSVGDDNLILEIAMEFDPELCVGNDIAWRQMSAIRKVSKSRYLNVIFTNHNITEMPFSIKFDTVIYKNTLHHVQNKEELIAILGKLKNLGKRVIIVDIENPKRELISKIFHLYYTYVYGDGKEEHHFFTRDTFEKLIQLAFPNTVNTQIEYLRTVRGYYMFAVIDF